MGARQQVVGFEGEPVPHPSAAGEPPAGQTRMCEERRAPTTGDFNGMCVRDVWARRHRSLSCKAPL